MLSNFEEILRAALSLPPEARAMLADHLLESLDAPNQKQIDAVWSEEAERRVRAIDEGGVELIPGNEVMAELRAQKVGGFRGRHMNNLIQSDPWVMMGKPVISGTRITVELILEKLGAGESIEQIIDAHPRLTREAILAVLDLANGEPR